MARLYTINHGKGFLRTDNSYRSNLDIVNKETLGHIARRLGIEGVAKSHSKERLAGTVSGYVLSHPEKCLGHFSVKELLLLKDFWHHANVVNSENAVVTLYAAVVYADRQTGRIIYRSAEPVEVRIDTDDLNSIIIPDLQGNCVCKFSTETEVMNYSFGVLTIEGIDESDNPYVVSLI